MTLSEIADFVGDKVGTPDAESLAIAKQFARRRYQMLWQRYTWQDTICYFSATLAADENEIECPSDAERVIALRLAGDTTAFPVNNTDIFVTDPEAFERSGKPTKWHEVLGNCQDYAPTTGEGPWAAVATSNADYGKTCSVVWLDTSGNIQKSSTTIAEVTSYDMAMGTVSEIISFSVSPVAVGIITLLATDPSQGGGAAHILAGRSTAERKTKLRVFDTPTEETDVYGMAKRRFPDMTNDSEVAIIRGLDLALLAYVEGDMLARQRQRGKAALCYQEAESHVRTLIDEERQQSARIIRLIPFVEAPPRHGETGKSFF